MEKWKKIKCIALDVDGVLTDGTTFLGANGEWCRNFYIRDGLGLVQLKKLGFKIAIITSTLAQDIRARAERLKVDFLYDNVSDKGEAFENLLQKSNLKPNEIVYIGDDVIDLPILNRVGIAVAPQDGHVMAKKAADIITKSNGGRGAVREICDILLSKGAFSKPNGKN